MRSNVISLDDKRREKQVQSEFEGENSPHAASPSLLLSLNLANWIAANFGDSEDLRANNADMQAALYFARGRVYYYRNSLQDAARAFAIVSATTDVADLKALSDLAYANAMFSMGEFDRAHSVLANVELADLPEAMVKCFMILEANVLFAKGYDLDVAATLYRKVLCEPSRSLWIRSLQASIASSMPQGKDLETGKGLTRLRDILDALLEMAVSRYFASLVGTL